MGTSLCQAHLELFREKMLLIVHWNQGQNMLSGLISDVIFNLSHDHQGNIVAERAGDRTSPPKSLNIDCFHGSHKKWLYIVSIGAKLAGYLFLYPSPYSLNLIMLWPQGHFCWQKYLFVLLNGSHGNGWQAGPAKTRENEISFQMSKD